MTNDVVVKATGLPPSEAIRFLRQKVNVPTERWGELEGEAHARSFAVAGATSNAVVQDFRKAVEKALIEGTTLEAFQKEFDSIKKRRGWEHTGTPGWRAEIIYSTNLSTAYSAGQYRQMTTPEALEMFPYWRYRHNTCQHPRILHQAWDGMILPADDPWWNTHFPPNGWRCHCTVEPVSRRMLRKRNWEVSEAPPLDPRPWRNPATGKTVMVPKGIDPGFDNNPGQIWLESERQQAASRLSPVTTIIGKPVEEVPASMRQGMQKSQIGKLLDDGNGIVEAGTAPKVVIQELKAESDGVLLSDESLGKNRRNHPELTKEEYEAIPQMLHRPAVITDAGPGHARVYAQHGKLLYRIVVKTTRNRKENFLMSFHPVSFADARRQIQSRGLLWGELPVEKDNGNGR